MIQTSASKNKKEYFWEFWLKVQLYLTYSYIVATSCLITLCNKFNQQSDDFIDLAKFSKAFCIFLDWALESSSFNEQILYFGAKGGHINVFLADECIWNDLVQLEKAEKNQPEVEFEVKTVAKVTSMFTEKFGTPRQSGMVTGAMGLLDFEHEWGMSDIMPGQYLILLFVFHLDVQDYNKLKSKILPPKLEGHKMGIFATRTPHRYNPIGLSIWKIEDVKSIKQLLISGIDLVDQTPILDAYVYQPRHKIDPNILTIPEWLENTKSKVAQVEWNSRSWNQLEKIWVNQQTEE